MMKFEIDGQIVLTSRATTQPTIRRILDKLATQNPGREVVAIYPEPERTPR